jgi:hypothetical protein
MSADNRTEIAAVRVMSSVAVDAGARFPSVFLVTGPGVNRVEVAAAPHLQPRTERSRTRWRALPQEGDAVWVGPISPAEEVPVRTAAHRARRDPPSVAGRAGSRSPTRPPRSAPAGTNIGAVSCAGDGVKTLGPSITEQPVLAVAPGCRRPACWGQRSCARRAGCTWSVICQGRTKPDGYEILESLSEGTVVAGPADADDLMAVIERSPDSPFDRARLPGSWHRQGRRAWRSATTSSRCTTGWPDSPRTRNRTGRVTVQARVDGSSGR